MNVLPPIQWRRRLLTLQRHFREARMLVRGLTDPDRPVLAHIIPIRRCNLSCAYCNEYDQVSPPVPLDVLKRRVDLLADLGVSIITMSGGEPLLHPELDDLIAHIRRRGAMASLITNGYYLVPERIQRLNRAGLEYVQISIDNIRPDATSKKSLKVLDKKLVWLAEHAEFDVNINSVIGAGVDDPEEAYTVAKRAHDLGFTSTVGIIHDGQGQLRPLTAEELDVHRRIRELGKRSYARLDRFQRNIAEGKPNDWRCRAGARYLYVCEEGLVHYCSQQRGYPGLPLERYTREDVRQAYRTRKDCAPRCTVSCVHKVSLFDFWRGPQDLKTPQPVEEPQLVQLQTD